MRTRSGSPAAARKVGAALRQHGIGIGGEKADLGTMFKVLERKALKRRDTK